MANLLNLTATQDTGKGTARRLLKREGVVMVPGYFNESLPGGIGQLALLRVDVDGFAGTYEALERLYPRLSVGGYVVHDDWKIRQSQQAVLHYRMVKNITSPLFAAQPTWPVPMKTQDCMVFWRKDIATG